MNKHKYLDNKGQHVIGGPLTGWIFSDAVRQNTCTKCQSEPGYHCETPKGRKAWPPHTQRLSVEHAKPMAITKVNMLDLINGKKK